MLTAILGLLAILFLSFYLWQAQRYGYWRRHNVKYIKPLPVVGNMKEIFGGKKNFPELLWNLYQNRGVENESVFGVFALFRPILFLREPELIKQILIKDFSSFSDRFMRCDPHHDHIGKYSLFFIRNPEWKELRAKITPVFTTGKIKQLFTLMQEVGSDLDSYLENTPNKTVLDFKELSSRFTMDLIASIAFGIKINSIQNPDNEYYAQFRSILKMTFLRALDFFCLAAAPELTTLFRVKIIAKKPLKFMRSIFNHIMEERERSGIERNDLIDILLNMKRKALEEPDKPNLALNSDYLVGQAAIFQTAGFETSSATLAFALYELAKQPQLQDRLRAEITKAIQECGGKISYERIQDMAFLGQVVDETLRMYPPLAFLERECTSKQGFSLQPYSDFVVPKGMPVYISLLGLHRDAKYWPNPDFFDPERFAPENHSNINWNVYLPFGAGPHNCIGMRIGLLQTKLGIVHILKNYRVVKCDQTTNSIRFNPKSFGLANEGGINLRMERV